MTLSANTSIYSTEPADLGSGTLADRLHSLAREIDYRLDAIPGRRADDIARLLRLAGDALIDYQRAIEHLANPKV